MYITGEKNKLNKNDNIVANKTKKEQFKIIYNLYMLHEFVNINWPTVHTPDKFPRLDHTVGPIRDSATADNKNLQCQKILFLTNLWKNVKVNKNVLLPINTVQLVLT